MRKLPDRAQVKSSQGSGLAERRNKQIL